MSTSQMVLLVPRSAVIYEGSPGLFDHLVLRLLSSAFEGTLPLLPLAVTPLIGRLVAHEVGSCTLILTVAELLSKVPSFALNVKESDPT